MTTVTRHFVTVTGRWGTRQVHYRRAGRGPAVLLLHQSPQSSRDLLPVLTAWALHFTLIAPDTPGFGQSEPLGPAAVPVEDFAEATLEFADAIGLTRFGVYGFHTGASIGLMLAARHRERVTALAAHGLTQLTPDERRDILANYLPEFRPAWDGSHLAWLWSRMREQRIFFPWYRSNAAARLTHDVPTPEALQADLLDFLRAGAHHAIAYRAAFESRPETVLPSFGVPLLVTAAAADPLQEHLARLGNLPPGAETARAATHVQALELSLRHLLAHRGDPAPQPVATRAIEGRLWRRMLTTAVGEVCVTTSLSGRDHPILLLHDAGASASALQPVAVSLAGQHPIVVPDLPGHGDSAWPKSPDGPTVRACAEAAHAVLAQLGMNRVLLAGDGAGAAIAIDIARRGTEKRPRLWLIDLPWLPVDDAATFRERGLPDLAPQWHGGHLLEAWHMLRDRRLFAPWFERNHRHALPGEPQLDPRSLQLELTDLLKAEGAWQNLMLDVLERSPTALSDLASHALAAARPAGQWSATTRAAALAEGLPFVALPEERGQRLPALLQHESHRGFG